MSKHIVALSGGKDSTAMALRLAEIEPRDYTYVCTPTGDELPEMLQHWNNLECILGKKIERIKYECGLNELIEKQNALPNWRQRWCTRILKIEPALEYYKQFNNVIAYVGLRADEEERGGLYSDLVEQRYPMREWGWSLSDVINYLNERGVKIPLRTDCARCYEQRLGEWWNLWKDHPDIYVDAEKQEQKYGHTFRSPNKDTWPASLAGLRKKFELGHIPRGANIQQSMFDDPEKCRACSL